MYNLMLGKVLEVARKVLDVAGKVLEVAGKVLPISLNVLVNTRKGFKDQEKL